MGTFFSRVVPIPDEEALNFLQTQAEQNFFQPLTRGDQPVPSRNTNTLPAVNQPVIIRGQSNTNLDSTDYNLAGYKPKPFVSNINPRPILGGPLLQLDLGQNTFLEQLPRPLYYQQPEEKFQQQIQDFQLQTGVSFFKPPKYI